MLRIQVTNTRPNEKVSDRSQPPVMLSFSQREPAGSGSLNRFFGPCLALHLPHKIKRDILLLIL